jgi:hypothetical protein
MRQLIALAILAALAVGGWMFWPQIKALVVSHAQGDTKTQDGQDSKTPAQVIPGPTSNPTPGSDSALPAPGASGTSPGNTTPGTATPPGSSATTPAPATVGVISGLTETKVEGPVTLDLRAVPDEKGGTFALEGTTNLLPHTELQIAITPRTGAVIIRKPHVEPGSPKNVFKSPNHQLPEGQYQIDVIMYVDQQPERDVGELYARPQALKGPLVFLNTPVGTIVRATGVLRKPAKLTTAVNIPLKAGTAK